MSVLRQAAKGGAWLAGFRFATQAVSWVATLAVARMLSPADYGLMSLASILTGYVEIFNELGLGAAIVQRPAISQEEYSSNFWFSLMVGVVFSLLAFGLAYPTAWLFNEPKVIPITQTISILFTVGALMTVPYNILMRNLQFKTAGMIQLCAVAISSSSMLWMAYKGFGVWTLIGGTIILRLVTVVLVFLACGWRPSFHFRWVEVRSFLRFGLSVVGSRSLFYIFQKSDVFIVGTTLGTQAVGLYSLAMQLANIPTDKLVSLVNQVAFPIFSRFQDDASRLRELYLRMSGLLVIVLAPLLLSGAIWGDQIVRAVLGDSWVSIIFMFRALCISQLFVSAVTLSNAVNTAVGRSRWVVYFHLVCVALMPAALYLAAPFGFDALVIPWLVVYPVICLTWTIITVRALGIPINQYLKASIHVLTALVLIGVVKGLFVLLPRAHFESRGPMAFLVQQVAVAGTLYVSYLWFREKDILAELWSLRSRQT